MMQKELCTISHSHALCSSLAKCSLISGSILVFHKKLLIPEGELGEEEWGGLILGSSEAPTATGSLAPSCRMRQRISSVKPWEKYLCVNIKILS